jgi:acetylornithine deacetylase/succinyl-diaminopimelate desuccinylase-like protein
MKQIPASFVQYTIDQCKTIQQIPSPTFNEKQKADYIAEQFSKVNEVDTVIDSTGNVLTKIRGIKSNKPIVISAHLDTVHPFETDLSISESEQRISGPSIGDNSLGLSALLMLLHYFHDLNIVPQQDIWLVANTTEEGLGNLEGMKAVANMFKDKPSAYLILEGMGLGRVVIQGLSVQRYRVTFQTNGGHSWADYGKPSAIHEMNHIIEKILALPIPDECKTTINIGKIEGGKSINTIAPEAAFEIDLRSEKTNVLQGYWNTIQNILKSEKTPDLRITWEQIGKRPGGAIKPGHALIQKTKQALQTYGIEPKLTSGSTDANIPLSEGYAAVCLGLTDGNHAHSMEEYIELAPLSAGLSSIIYLLNLLWEKPKPSRRPPGRKRN